MTPSPREERKVVSVLFCDLVGSTARADGADPEDVEATLGVYQDPLRTELERSLGTVEKFIGDAVMAVFGAPLAREDDAERAVRAGLAILAAIDALNQRHPGLDLEVRIGVATGEGLVRLGTRPERGQGIVVGDVVNTAARLEASAPPGAVVVGAATHRLTSDRIDYDALESVWVKGKAASLEVWRARSAHARTGTEAGTRSATALVGRQDELAVLRGAFARAAAEPGLQLVTVTGEPGVGKSRLVAELFAWIDARQELTRWRQGRCLPYGDGVTFAALGEVVKAEAGVMESDDEATAQAKLKGAVAALGTFEDADADWVCGCLAPLVGLSDKQGGATPEQRFGAWQRFLESLAAETPLVLVVEDAHWADAALMSFLGHLLEWSEGVAILLVVTARPELATKHPGWATGAANATSLALGPLSEPDTARLLAGLLGTSLLAAELQSRLLERTGGNPLYAEQVVRLLEDLGALRRRGKVVELDPAAEVPVPESVSALIAARLDTLDTNAKWLLADAAVVGRVFWSGTLVAMGERREVDVRQALRLLSRAVFVRRLPRSSVSGEQEYSFVHALVRDVAYATLPRAARASRHLAAAAWIEAMAGDRVADASEVLASHYLTALELRRATGDTTGADALGPPAVRFLALAANRAEGIDEVAAEAHYGRAARLVSTDSPERPQLLFKWGWVSRETGHPEQAERALQEALTLAEDSGDHRSAGSAMVGLARLADDRGDNSAQDRLLAAATAHLESVEVGDMLLQAYQWSAFRHAVAGRPVEALKLVDRVLELASAHGTLPLESLITRGYARSMLGDPASLADGREAVRLARLQPGHLPYVLANAAEDVWLHEGPRPGLAMYRESRETALRQARLVSVTVHWAESLRPMFDLGLWDEVLATAAELRPQFEAGIGRLYIVAIEPYRAAVLRWRGALAEASDLAEEQLAPAREITDLQILLPALASAALAREAAGEDAGALQLVDEYQAAVEGKAGGVGWYWGWRHLTDLVRICVMAGDLDRAERLLAGPEPIMRRHVLAVRSSRATLAEAYGSPAAGELYAEAATGWHDYESVLEEGFSLLGLGRCLLRAGRPAEAPLAEARALFVQLGAAPLVADANAWFERTVARTS